MSTTRELSIGATRVCPHCKATILESANVCPACRHHLRAGAPTVRTHRLTSSALTVEGTVRHPDVGEAWEYTVLVSVHDAEGRETSRQVMGVGVLHPGQLRSFRIDVQVHVPA